MTDTIEVLCIGGKHDGRRVRVRRHHVNVLYLHDYFPLPAPLPPKASSPISESIYYIEEFRSGDRSFWTARPPDQSQQTTFALLMQGYRGV